MKNNKKIMLFNATILVEGVLDDSSRDGIYFVAYNILKEFIKTNLFEIYFYCEPKYAAQFGKALCEDLKEFKNIKIMNMNLVKSSIFFLNKINHYNNKYKKLKQANKHKYIRRFYTKLKRGIFSLMNKLLKPFVNNYFKKQLPYVDIYFSPRDKVPNDIEKINNIKKYIVLHDLIPMVLPNRVIYPKGWFASLLKTITPNDHYFIVSEYTKKDFLRFYPEIISDINTTVTPPACSKVFQKVDEKDIFKAKEKYNIPVSKEYIFNLNSLDPRKNQIRIIRSFVSFIKKHKIEDLFLVIRGKDGLVCGNKKLKECIDNLEEYKNKIITIDYIDDEDLPSLYSGAKWFVYTSQYEGFGLPPLEAMSCGCPVITSNNTSLPEVVGDAGIMIDWGSDEQHIMAYEKYYFNEQFRSEMSKKGFERSKQFSWEKCVSTMIKVMTK